MDNSILDFHVPTTDSPKIIKVIGVGGGGGNAVSNMYREGIQDVTFLLCNTDNQALQKSEVPNKLLIGRNTTHGLGSGNVPEVGEKAAKESEEDIRRILIIVVDLRSEPVVKEAGIYTDIGSGGGLPLEVDITHRLDIERGHIGRVQHDIASAVCSLPGKIADTQIVSCLPPRCPELQMGQPRLCIRHKRLLIYFPACRE